MLLEPLNHVMCVNQRSPLPLLKRQALSAMSFGGTTFTRQRKCGLVFHQLQNRGRYLLALHPSLIQICQPIKHLRDKFLIMYAWMIVVFPDHSFEIFKQFPSAVRDRISFVWDHCHWVCYQIDRHSEQLRQYPFRAFLRFRLQRSTAWE